MSHKKVYFYIKYIYHTCKFCVSSTSSKRDFHWSKTKQVDAVNFGKTFWKDEKIIKSTLHIHKVIIIIHFIFFSIISCIWFFREGEGEEAERKGGRERERERERET